MIICAIQVKVTDTNAHQPSRQDSTTVTPGKDRPGSRSSSSYGDDNEAYIEVVDILM